MINYEMGRMTIPTAGRYTLQVPHYKRQSLSDHRPSHQFSPEAHMGVPTRQAIMSAKPQTFAVECEVLRNPEYGKWSPSSLVVPELLLYPTGCIDETLVVLVVMVVS